MTAMQWFRKSTELRVFVAWCMVAVAVYIVGRNVGYHSQKRSDIERLQNLWPQDGSGSAMDDLNGLINDSSLRRIGAVAIEYKDGRIVKLPQKRP